MQKIFIIEDSKDINIMLAQMLEDEGYEVKSAFTGLEAMTELKKEKYDLILLDIMLPYISGDQILKELRAFSEVPVIVISAKDMVGTKIDLLKLGADDYITKPFDLGEVSARISSNLRRFYKNNEIYNVIKYKDIVINTNTKQVIANGVELDLTAKEYLIIELLFKNLGKVFSKANIYESIWQEEYIGDDNAVKTHMSNLRSKLKKASPGQQYIETVWGLGYRIYK